MLCLGLVSSNLNPRELRTNIKNNMFLQGEVVGCIYEKAITEVVALVVKKKKKMEKKEGW